MAFWVIVFGIPLTLVACVTLAAFVAWWRVVLVLLTALVALATWVWLYDRTNQRFNAEAWKADAAKPCLKRNRDRMVSDLIEHHLPGTMSRREVSEVLGRPDRTDPDRQAGGVYWQWGLGSGGTGFSCHSLLIDFVGDGIYTVTPGYFG